KLAIFILLTVLLAFVLFELYNISALYNDQVGMSEMVSGTSTQAEASQLNDFKFELNTWRAIYILYIVFYVGYVVRMFYKALKPVSQ
ncbi:MAG TPA: hypothetical protein VN698_08225, partial [Bacteroidia bacterium]|nr:hypothetical protein [Bacteroidia bacterium]